MKINQLDLFSGIGGFHLGFEKAGYSVKSFFSEIDKHSIAVYKNKFKNSTYVGSVTDIQGRELPAKIDLVTFGSPCQDFSVSNANRTGMAGKRSSLILEAIRLIGECRPRVFIWENVKGTFSSNSGEDFAAILQAFANIGGYRLEWELLNSANYLPQNRERIYLVGYSTTTKRNWRGIFPLGKSSEKNIDIPRQQGNICTLTTRYGQANGNGSYITERKQYAQEVKVGTWRTHKDGQGFREVKGDDCPTIPARARDDGSGQPVIKAAKIASEKYTIRRLTPIECERLQGFPDNHTEYGDYDGKIIKVSNAQRYRQCGNAVTVNVVQALAEKCKILFK